MGAVYRALHVSLGAPRAIKVMRRELAEDAAFVERFQAEARLVEGLRHPSLVALHDFGRLADGTWYIASELVEGETLAALLARGARFSSADVAHLLGPICDGLALAHRKGIVHRDISPDNVMVTRPDGEEPLAKLLDFGVAKDLVKGTGARTGPTLLLGKVGYASPEQMGLIAAGQGIDVRSDVFSLAAVAYQMLAGALPWRRDDLRSYVHDLIVRPEAATHAEVTARVPEPWRDTFARALVRDRERRTPSMQAFKADLAEAARRASGGERSLSSTHKFPTTVPGTASGAAASGPVVRRGRVALPLVAGAALAVALLAAAAFWRIGTALLGARASPGPQATAPVLVASPAPPATLAPDANPAPRALVSADASSHPSPTGRTASGTTRATTSRQFRAGSPTAAGDGESSRHQPTADAAPAPEPSPEAEGPGEASPSAAKTPAEPVLRDGDVEERATAQQPARFGSLSVSADVWVNVSVDGGPPLQTPVYIGRLPAGPHTLRAWRPGFKEQTLDLEVPEGDTRRVVLGLEREEP
jgi:serine/threonine-protein kinase